ncbi:protein-glutamate O-methyltransferase CheR, partial [Dissulfurirhabdus thermomarina]
MNTERIEVLLNRAIGLHVDSIGHQALVRAVRRRMDVVGLDDPREYTRILYRSPGELDALVEEVVVPETWFFRDGAPFRALAEYAVRKWRPAHPAGRLRCLSVPCSSGEEPYSMVMALLDAGLPDEAVHVDAVDVSSRALEKARRGEYTAHSFRGRDLGFRARYFRPDGRRYVIDGRVRACVRFHRANLLDPDFYQQFGVYDVVFCRNLLIYLDEAAQEQAMATLRRLVSDQGLLFVGHAETARFPEAGFRPAPYPRAFAFQIGTAPRPPAARPKRPPLRRPVAPPAGRNRA